MNLSNIEIANYKSIKHINICFEALTAIDTASIFIIGYGFNDEHLETLQRNLISYSENVA